MYVKVTDKDGNPIDSDNGLYVTLTSADGTAVVITPEGKLSVDASINVESVTATDVTIKDPTDGANKMKVNADGSILSQLTGSLMQQYGATVASRPAANAVPVGAYFMAVDTQDIWQSNGSSWVEVG